MSSRKVAMVARKFKLGQEPKDRASYLLLSDEDRIGLVEEIRREYHGWTDQTEPRIERVCRVYKRQ